MRPIVPALVLAAFVAACGTPPKETSPVYDPTSTPTEAPAPLAPTPTPKDADPNVATRLTLYKTVITRHWQPFTLAELQAMGWYEVDLAGGKASYFDKRYGRETVTWAAPPKEIRVGHLMWISGKVTALSGTNLNLQASMRAHNFDTRKAELAIGGMSTDGRELDLAEERTELGFRLNAIPGEEARIDVWPGWQADGVNISYHFRYEP